MKIALIVEGTTEKAFLPILRKFLENQLAGKMPNIDIIPYDGRIPTKEKLHRLVLNLLSGSRAADCVIALTDVYTGTDEFRDASEAKDKMRQWVGPEARFYPHAAQYDFEAWLLPYWSTIQKLARHNRKCPAGNPELVNHNNPPAHRIKEIFELGECKKSYIKPRDAKRILSDKNLMVAIDVCVELKAFVNTILSVSGGQVIS